MLSLSLSPHIPQFQKRKKKFFPSWLSHKKEHQMIAFFKMVLQKMLRFSQSFSRVCFWKVQNNVKPLKLEPYHISMRPGVHQITAEYSSAGEARKPSQKPAWSPLHALHLPQQLVIVVLRQLECQDWRTVTRCGDAGRFIVTRSIIRAMIITGSINFGLHSSSLCCYYLTVTSLCLDVYSFLVCSVFNISFSKTLTT